MPSLLGRRMPKRRENSLFCHIPAPGQAERRVPVPFWAVCSPKWCPAVPVSLKEAVLVPFPGVEGWPKAGSGTISWYLARKWCPAALLRRDPALPTPVKPDPLSHPSG